MPDDLVLQTDTLVSPDSLMQQDSLWSVDSIGELQLPLYGRLPDSLIERPLVVWDVTDWTFVSAYSVSPKVSPIPDFPNHVRTYFPSDLFMMVLLISATLLVIIRANYYKIFSQIFTAVFSYRSSVRIFSSRTELYRNMSVLVRMLFLINVSLFVHELFWWYGTSLLGLPLALSLVLVAGIVGVLCVVNYLVCKFLGAVFVRTVFFDEYLHNVFVFYMAYAVLLAIPVFSIPFVPDAMAPVLIWTGLGMGIVLLLMRLFRSFQIIVAHRFPVFYFLLYLCTLEIIPVLIFIKAVQQLL